MYNHDNRPDTPSPQIKLMSIMSHILNRPQRQLKDNVYNEKNDCIYLAS